jgi:putative glutamine amidotransferase
VVGLTPDVGHTAARPGRPPVPRYELKQAYADAVLAAGGLPLILPYSEDETAPAEAVSLCDALVITGGAFDIPPEAYGRTRHRLLGDLKPTRTQYEQRVLRAALDAGLPVLGVCGGMQLLAVELGGTLIQDIRDELPEAFDHEQ